MIRPLTQEELNEQGLLNATFQAARMFEKDKFVNAVEFEKLYAKSTRAVNRECHCEELICSYTSGVGMYKVRVHVGRLSFICCFAIMNALGKFEQGTSITSAHSVTRE